MQQTEIQDFFARHLPSKIKNGNAFFSHLQFNF